MQQSARTVAAQLQSVVSALQQPGSGVAPQVRATLTRVQPPLAGAIESLSAAPQGDKPVTLGIGEPFTTTVGIAFIFAMILSLPVVLYELYAFLCRRSAPSSGARRRR